MGSPDELSIYEKVKEQVAHWKDNGFCGLHFLVAEMDSPITEHDGSSMTSHDYASFTLQPDLDELLSEPKSDLISSPVFDEMSFKLRVTKALQVTCKTENLVVNYRRGCYGWEVYRSRAPLQSLLSEESILVHPSWVRCEYSTGDAGSISRVSISLQHSIGLPLLATPDEKRRLMDQQLKDFLDVLRRPSDERVRKQ